MTGGNFYLNAAIPFTLQTSGGANLCPILTVVTPTQVKTYDTSTGVSLLSSNNVPISNTIYTLDFVADELGAYRYFWRVIDCTTPTTDLTNTVVCGCIAGSLIIIKNPLDETLSDHLISGTLGYKLEKLISQTLGLERRGTGECLRQVKIKGATTTIGFVYNESGQAVAQASGEPSGPNDSVLNFYLNTGTYKLRVIDPSNCNRKPVNLVFTVDCTSSDSGCQESSF